MARAFGLTGRHCTKRTPTRSTRLLICTNSAPLLYDRHFCCRERWSAGPLSATPNVTRISEPAASKNRSNHRRDLAELRRAKKEEVFSKRIQLSEPTDKRVRAWRVRVKNLPGQRFS